MKERPILMNAFSVRAILDGRKTQTRRVIKPQPYGYAPTEGIEPGTWLWVEAGDHGYGEPVRCPYGAPGDRLLVRETWRAKDDYSRPCPGGDGTYCAEIEYRADGVVLWRDLPDDTHYQVEWFRKLTPWVNDPDPSWRPSIHMPLWASRLTLEIEKVEAVPVQDISPWDCMREGLKPLDASVAPGPRARFAALWNEINAGRGFPWQANPWVWAIAFEVVND